MSENIIGSAPEEQNGQQMPQEQNGQQAPQEQKINWKKELLSWVIIIAVAYILAQIITKCIIMKTVIISGSMIPTLTGGLDDVRDDIVIGKRLSYLFDDPERGDVVFFAFPDDEKQVFVKRIIGLPGETVHIVDGKVYIDDSPKPLDEPYLNEPMDDDEDLTFTVPEDSYFMLGDNRNNSRDSRYWRHNFVERDKIYAKAWFKFAWPLESVKSAVYD